MSPRHQRIVLAVGILFVLIMPVFLLVPQFVAVFVIALALGVTFLVSRLVRLILKRQPEPRRSVLAAVITAGVMVVMNAYRYAHGMMPPQFAYAARIYVPAALIGLFYDVIRWRLQTAKR